MQIRGGGGRKKLTTACDDETRQGNVELIHGLIATIIDEVAKLEGHEKTQYKERGGAENLDQRTRKRGRIHSKRRKSREEHEEQEYQNKERRPRKEPEMAERNSRKEATERTARKRKRQKNSNQLKERQQERRQEDRSRQVEKGKRKNEDMEKGGNAETGIRRNMPIADDETKEEMSGRKRHKTDRSPLNHRFGPSETRRLGKWEDREGGSKRMCENGSNRPTGK